MIITASLGKYIRSLRETEGLPLRIVGALIGIDTSTLSKIERGERIATREMLPLFSKLFKIDERDLRTIYLSDKIAEELSLEEDFEEILKLTKSKVISRKGKLI